MLVQLILLLIVKCNYSNIKEADINSNNANKFHIGKHSQIIAPETEFITVTEAVIITTHNHQEATITIGASGDKF